jgi:hypothetical protein
MYVTFILSLVSNESFEAGDLCYDSELIHVEVMDYGHFQIVADMYYSGFLYYLVEKKINDILRFLWI